MPLPSPRPLPAGFLARPIAHRGLHDVATGVIENTPTAFAAAIAGNYGIECDIQISADGEAMVFHDFTLDRLTTAEGRVDSLPASELQKLGFRAGTDGMATLGALFDQVGGRVPLVVEIKSRFDGDTALAPRIAALAGAYAGPLAFKSFDPGKIIALRDAGVQQPLGIVGEESYAHGEYARLSPQEKHALANLLHFDRSRPDFLSWNHKNLPSAGPYLCRIALGLPVMSWTIRSAEAARLVAPHIDQIVFEGFDPG
jgi:glycerophosphoryl diester phosphodiesterase